MERSTMRRKAQRVVRFVLIQFIALVGWILVQLLFALSPVGHSLSFILILFIEAIWWMALLMIMLLLFLLEYNRFVQAAVDLEAANWRLREATNKLLERMTIERTQGEAIDTRRPDGGTTGSGKPDTGNGLSQ